MQLTITRQQKKLVDFDAYLDPIMSGLGLGLVGKDKSYPMSL